MIERALFYTCRLLIKIIGARPMGEALAHEVGGPDAALQIYLMDDEDEEEDDDDGGERTELDPIWDIWDGGADG